MLFRTFLILICVFSLIGTPEAAARTWTAKNGRTTTGEFVRLHDGQIVLKRGGRVVTIPLSAFCERDQAYIEDLAAGRVPAEGTEADDDGGESKSESATKAFPTWQPPQGAQPEEPASDVPTPEAEVSTPEPEPKIPAPEAEPASDAAPEPPAAEVAPKKPKASPWPTASFTPPSATDDDTTTSNESSALAEPAVPPVTPVLKEKICPYCNKSIPPDIGVGDVCPECGAVFSGQYSSKSGSGSGFGAIVFLVLIFVVPCFLVFLHLRRSLG